MQKNQLFFQKKQEAVEESLGNGKILQALQEAYSSQGNQVSLGFCVIFVNLLREAFDADESKFRLLIHIHEYHNDLKQRKFWSKATGISLKQFTKSYVKPHTGKNKRKDYPGCASLRYYDYRIALELEAIYNIFSDKFRRVA